MPRPDFFFGMEKKNGQCWLIHCLRSIDGKELTKISDIRRRAVNFYEELYASEHEENVFLAQKFYKDLPQVPKESFEELMKPLSKEEMHISLQSFKNGKAPGIDGLPVYFYKAYWEIWGDDLLEVLNESLNGGQLPQSCKKAVLTLLPKKGDLKEIKNWRPVALLCADYKILSKTLANRLKKVMGMIIHIDESYCIPKRSIVDNISLIRDVLVGFKDFWLKICSDFIRPGEGL